MLTLWWAHMVFSKLMANGLTLRRLETERETEREREREREKLENDKKKDKY